MSRLTDPIAPSSSGSPLSGVPAADDRSAANQLRDGLSGKQVCPFCGSQNPVSPAGGTASGPCPRCTMEDSAATRQATKARIGPWHVLQTRNPAAPGMRYATLLALVGKGQVTARSVVRGPTTHQLWRYAAHVKGLSREFGVCYSCGEPIDKTAANCPHCDRAQEPAGNPDALLESREPSAAIGAATAGNGSAAAIAASVIAPNVAAAMSPTMALSDPPVHDPYSIVRQPAPAPVLSHAERLRTGISHSSEVRRRPDGRVLSAMELAAALQISPPAPAPQTHPVRTVLITLLIVGILACGIIGFARPDLRRQAQNWSSAELAQIEQGLANFHLQKDPPADPGAQPPDGSTDTATGTTSTTGNSTGSTTGDLPAPAPSDVAPPHDDSTPSAPSIKITPGGNAGAVNLVTTGTPPPASTGSAPMAVTQATAGSQEAARPSLLPDRPILVGSAPSSNEIWLLHSRGLNAEARQDWAQAVQCYEQIELAPRDEWPSDVKIRLENAKRELGN